MRKQKISAFVTLLAMVFAFAFGSYAKALTFDEIKRAQSGKVLGEISALYPYPSGSLINDGGTIYFISGTTKIPFTNWPAFVGLGYSLRNVVKGDLSAYTPSQSYMLTTASAEHPWGSWLLHNGTVYYAHETGLIGVPSWDIFLNNGGNAKYIVKANSYDIGVLNSKTNLPLLQYSDSRIYGIQQQNPVAFIPVVPPSPTPTASTSPASTPAPISTVPAPAPINYLQKQALVFQIDQGFGNGIIQNQDLMGLQRVVDTLKVFQNKYEVYVTLSARQTEKSKLDWALSLLTQNNIPFILEVYASDALTTGVDAVNHPHDVQHGRAMSVDQLQQYKNKYGKNFAGVRGLEIFAANFTVLACQKLGVNWCDAYKQNLPSDNFYQKSFLEDYIKFAKNNDMFVLFSDFYWSVYHPWDFDQNTVKQPQNELELQSLVKAYPNIVVVMFANNEPAEGSKSKINSWQSVVKPYMQYGAKGFGLSNQSWMCANETTCPADEMVNWANTAFAAGALVVQTEPYWYWWHFPKGAIGPQSSNYTQDPQWTNRGYATGNLQLWASKLWLTLPGQPAILTNNARCVSVDAPDWITPGASFTGKVTVKNIGTTTWTQNSSTNLNPYRLAAGDFKLPPYTTSIWGSPKIELPVSHVNPGDSVTFAISTTAPNATSTYSFGWQMLQDYKEWFGDTCSKQIQVSTKVPPPTNPTAVCPAPGASATIGWTAPTGYDTFYVRAKLWPNPSDGSGVVWDDKALGASYTFNTTSGLSYNWWVHTRDPQTGEASDAAGSTFTCPIP